MKSSRGFRLCTALLILTPTGCSNWSTPLSSLWAGDKPAGMVESRPDTDAATPTNIAPVVAQPLVSSPHAHETAPQTGVAGGAAPTHFVATTSASGDARGEALDYCTEKGLFPKLVRAERLPAPDPADDQIRWYFDCTY